MAAICLHPVLPSVAQAQDNWAADDDAVEARKIERYQQLVDHSPEKSYAFNQLMATVGKGAAYQKLLNTYQNKVNQKPKDFNLRMVLGHMYLYGGRTAEAIQSYRSALEIKATPLVYQSIASAEADNKNFEEAVQNYEAALNLSTSRDQKQEIWRALAEIALYRRDMARAQVCFAELIKLEPNSLFVRRELSQIYAQNRLYDEARQVLTDSLKVSGLSANDKDQIELDIAQLYEQEGNDNEALARYEALSKRLGSNHWMQREIIGHLVDIHRSRGTLSELAQTLENTWKSPSYTQHLELADLYDESRQPQAALDHIQKAIAQSPKSPEAREKLIQYYRSHGMTQEMIQAKVDLAKAVPDNPEYRFDLYETWGQQKKLDDALAVLDEMTKKFSGNFEVLHQVAELYQMQGRRAKAKDIYTGWLKKHPNDIEAIEALGNLYDDGGEKKNALATWASIEKIPMDKQLKLETLARIYDEHGYTREAEALYADAVAASPRDCQTRAQYAEILTRSKKQEQAMEAWTNLATTCPGAATRTLAAKQIAALYRVRGNQKKGLLHFKGLCESKPNDLTLVLLFAEVASEMNLRGDATEQLENYLGRHPGDADAIHALSALQADMGNYEKARATLAPLVSSNESQRYDALVAMADLDEKTGDFEAAQKHLDEALQLNASDSDLHERMGDLLLRRHLYDDALKYYDSAFMMDSRNFSVAFKTATTYSILGKDKEADDIYIQIVTQGSDETLMLKAAQRAIDDGVWNNSLDEIAKNLMPLARSKRHKELYLDILMQLAQAQAQPHVLALRTMDARHAPAARHALKELAETYSPVMLESLVSSDAALQAQAITLSNHLASAQVIQILGKIIEDAPVSEDGRQTQESALEAIAHAQSPIAIPILKSCIESKNPRRLREMAIWALGLISAPDATAELVKILDNPLDSMRALAIIGLGRQGEHPEAIKNAILDPSSIVQAAAIWALAHHRDFSATTPINQNIRGFWTTPNELWSLSRLGVKEASTNILTQLWCGNAQNRNMAIRVMRTPADAQPADLSQLTRGEWMGRYLIARDSDYANGFDIQGLLDEFAEIESETANPGTAAGWLQQNREGFLAVVTSVAQDTMRYSLGGDCRCQMMQDLTGNGDETGIRWDDPAQVPILTQAIQDIQPQIQEWTTSDDARLAAISMIAGARTQSAQSFEQAIDLAHHGESLAQRIQAIDAIANYPDGQEALRKLAKDDHYLVRATALSHLDPSQSSNRSLLEKATKDDFLIVSETAKKQLATP